MCAHERKRESAYSIFHPYLSFYIKASSHPRRMLTSPVAGSVDGAMSASKGDSASIVHLLPTNYPM